MLAQFAAHPVQCGVHGARFYVEPTAGVAEAFAPNADGRMIPDMDGADGIFFVSPIRSGIPRHTETVVRREALRYPGAHGDRALRADSSVLLKDRLWNADLRDLDIV